MKEEIINREAGGTSKGFRLQKLRAVKRMLEFAAENSTSLMFWAIENDGDVYQENGNEIISEEDKFYDKKTSFTINSGVLKNSLVIFCDLWIKYDYSDLLSLCFYSTNKCGKEYNTGLIFDLGIDIPEDGILQSIVKGCITKEIAESVSKIVLHEYEDQYKNTTKKGNINELRKWTIEKWIEFLNIIQWEFGGKDAIELKAELIKNLPFHKWYCTVNHPGKEDYIITALIDILDERQEHKDPIKRLISSKDVEMEFIIAKGQSVLKKDPLYEMWNKIPMPTDKRNIEEKVKAVCNDNYVDLITEMQISSVEGGLERQTFESDQSYTSMRWRVYSKSKELFKSKLRKINTTNLEYTTIEEILEEAKICAHEEIAKHSSVYHYTIGTETSIKNIISELIDSCYLAFENGRRPEP